MKNKLYLECFSGISGDMMVAALIDLGANQEVLNRALESLPIQGFQTKISRVKKSGLDVCDFAVNLESKYENHDHDMEYLHGKEGHIHEENVHHEHTHGEHAHDGSEHAHGGSGHTHGDHTHEDHTHDSHSHEENGHVHSHSHEHRGLQEIASIIDQAGITSRAKELANRIFYVLAKAEAKVHGTKIDQVHFHEVGAIDSIVDIVAVAVCIDNLGIEDVIVPVLYEGTGFIRCQHGIIPVPVPAVSAIAADSGLHFHITDTEGEFVTPTGAAIVAALITDDTLPKQFAIQKIGIGAGKRNYEKPSLLRAMLIQEDEKDRDIICKLESNIDDCSGEALGYVMECLLEAGALDVHYSPTFMKKNRPAYQLNVICKTEDISKLEQIIFKETTTIGIRKIIMERTILKRRLEKIQTTFGEVQVKICDIASGSRCYPEYSSVIDICKRENLSYQDVYHKILEEYHLQNR